MDKYVEKFLQYCENNSSRFAEMRYLLGVLDYPLELSKIGIDVAMEHNSLVNAYNITFSYRLHMFDLVSHILEKHYINLIHFILTRCRLIQSGYILYVVAIKNNTIWLNRLSDYFRLKKYTRFRYHALEHANRIISDAKMHSAVMYLSKDVSMLTFSNLREYLDRLFVSDISYSDIVCLRADNYYAQLSRNTQILKVKLSSMLYPILNTHILIDICCIVVDYAI
jgi:hypothetical protein